MRLERLREDPEGLAGIELTVALSKMLPVFASLKLVVVLGSENMNCPVMSSQARGVAVMIPCI